MPHKERERQKKAPTSHNLYHACPGKPKKEEEEEEERKSNQQVHVRGGGG